MFSIFLNGQILQKHEQVLLKHKSSYLVFCKIPLLQYLEGIESFVILNHGRATQSFGYFKALYTWT